MSKLQKALEKQKDIEWIYVKGKRTPFLNGKQVTVGTRHRDLLKAAGGDLSNAFRDILKIGRRGKNPEFDEYGRPLNILEAEYRKRGAYAKAKEQSPDVQPRTWSNDPTQKYNKPSSVDNPLKEEKVPPDNKTNYVQTPSPTWGVEKKSKSNLVKTPSPTWTVDQERAKWLNDTKNSPAAKAGLSDDLRWEARQRHIKFQNKRKNKKKLSVKG